ncbi:helix-turn-helix domain-containing protein [Stenotrophomonas sp. Iso1]|uniref:helix-turn-helix transcriptional regulator n=1 Tax=Stenotrophomonas sp. Iso1 TaxID=2977283 RepID=UPI0022B7ABDD|nr:helix-turn-helix domain-containing protein [Stenotrophomonas sp. Iso1]
MPNHLANRIRRARRKKGMTQAELASQLKVSRSAVGNWESPTGIMPCTTRMITIAMVTDVSFEWLATGRNGLEVIPAPPQSNVEMVDDPHERRLLMAYRTCRAATRKLVLQIVEGQRLAQV